LSGKGGQCLVKGGDHAAGFGGGGAEGGHEDDHIANGARYHAEPAYRAKHKCGSGEGPTA